MIRQETSVKETERLRYEFGDLCFISHFRCQVFWVHVNFGQLGHKIESCVGIPVERHVSAVGVAHVRLLTSHGLVWTYEDYVKFERV